MTPALLFPGQGSQAVGVGAALAAGADRFAELDPGSVLYGLNKRNAKGIACTWLGEPADLEPFREGMP